MPDHVIKSGETVAYLAELHGLSARAVWAHPANEALRSRRRRMDALAPGDVLHLPAQKERTEVCATDCRHRFRRIGVPARIRIRFLEQGVPRSNQPYVLDVAGRTQRGNSDANGVVEAFVPASAREAHLRLGGGDEPPILLRLGGMEPDNTISGVRKRLANLGIAAPQGDDPDSEEWKLAIFFLQRKIGGELTGRLDDAIRQSLWQMHDQVGDKRGAQS